MKPLKVIYSKYIPFKGYVAITLFDYLVVREEYKEKPLSWKTHNHEAIHQAQAYDFGIGFCGYFIFYILYILEWILKLPLGLFNHDPYYNISFEQEAFSNQDDSDYLDHRRRFAWTKYIFKLA